MNIKISNLSKKIKDNRIISNANLYFEEGNIYGLYGKNGTGKSVLLKLLVGYYKPDRGEITFDNKNYNVSDECIPNLRCFIEKPAFFPNLTGYENLKLLANIENKINDEAIIDSLKTVNLLEEKDKKYSKYSLGMKQKLGIAQALMEDSKILVLDEPFNGIEEETIDKLISYLKTIKKDKIIIISSHSKEELFNLSDKIYYFSNNNIKEIDK